MGRAAHRRLRHRAAAVTLASVVTFLPFVGSAAAEDPDSDGCGKLLPKAGGGTWTCTFIETFPGETLNTDKWRAQETWLTGFKTGDTCYDDTNIVLRNGKLVLRATRLEPFTCVSPYGNYTTRYKGGMVTTHSKFAQAFGRFEVRLAVPEATKSGLMGGFWMYPETPAYGEWPKSGELDVAEWWSSNPDTMFPSLHYEGSGFLDTWHQCHIANIDRFHTYAVEWYRSVMKFYYDGELCFRREWQPTAKYTGSQPFDQPFNLVLNMGFSSADADENRLTWATEAPRSLIVDYAKAWK